MNAEQIIHVFNQTFLNSENTRLMGGAEEPLYTPASSSSDNHCIYFRLDYAASALHEIAHWCIAGKDRRLLEDYGYWYSPDGRSLQKQREFERVEIKPQALESIFAKECGVKFVYSADNLVLNCSNLTDEAMSFERAVDKQVGLYNDEGLPPRADTLVQAIRLFLAK